MKKVLLLALSLTAAGYTAQAQAMKPANATEKVAGPAIVFEESKYEFKPITQGEVVDHVFKFKNTGTAPLIILQHRRELRLHHPRMDERPGDARQNRLHLGPLQLGRQNGDANQSADH